MVDYNIAWIVGTVIGVGGLSVALVWNIINFKYRKKSDDKLDKNMVLQLAEQTLLKQSDIADKLKAETARIAKETKDEMHEYVDAQTEDLEKDFDHKVEMIYGKLDLINKDITGVIKDIADAAKLNAETASRLEKGMDFLKQFTWGQSTKSQPPFLEGEEETIRHKNKEGEGIFKDTEQESIEREFKDDEKENVVGKMKDKAEELRKKVEEREAKDEVLDKKDQQ